MRKMSRWGLAALALACVAGTGSCINAKNPNTVTQAFMWVATIGDQLVRSYTVQLDNGAIAQVGNAISTGVQPQAMAITPDGQTVFVANTGDSTIGIYAVNSDGSLSSVSSKQSSGQMPVALAVDPTGKFLFAVDRQTGDISAYQITGTSSSLSLKPSPPTPIPTPGIGIALPSSPTALAVSPSGSYVYATDSANNTVAGFSYDNTGTLTPLPSGPQGLCQAGYCVQVGTNPAGLAFSRCAGVNSAAPTVVCNTADSDNLFVSNEGSNTISIFSACIQVSAACPSPNGTLTAVGTPVAACCGPTNFMVDPQLNFVYVLEAGSTQIGQFGYAPVNGTLTPLSPASASTGAAPFAASISANTSNTNWIFVSDAGASTLSGFAITGAGRLTGLSSGPFAVPAQPAAILLH